MRGEEHVPCWYVVNIGAIPAVTRRSSGSSRNNSVSEMKLIASP